jgi:hypothetical protein
MTGPLPLVLMVAPLAGYLYMLAVLHSGRRPHVVSGTVDVALLGMGVGGLIIFGPFGQLVARMIFGRPDPVDWLLLTLAGLVAVAWRARRAAGRLVIYRVDPEALERALAAALGPEPFRKTHQGYEDLASGRGIRVELSPRWRTAVLEGFGPGGDALIGALAPRLRQSLDGPDSVGSEVAAVLFGLSVLAVLAPLTGYLLAQPRARAALRVFFEQMRGG